MTSETMPSAVPPVPVPAAPSRPWLSAVVLAALLAMPWWISYVAVVRARQMSAIFADLMGDSALPGLTSGVLASAPWWWLLPAALSLASAALLARRQLSLTATVLLGLLALGATVLMAAVLSVGLMGPLLHVMESLAK